jgi:hypothetical protein
MGAKNTTLRNFNLISYNCDLFCYNFIRYNELLKFIKNIDEDYVICLQGISDNKTFNKLLEDLKSIQSYNKIIPSLYNNKNIDIIKKNGLCIISSIKFYDYYFNNITFKSSIYNLLNNSGYIKCSININSYKLNIYNINIDKSKNIIKNELISKNLLILIENIIRNHKNNNIYYITGNFNIIINNNIKSIKIINLFNDYQKNIINLVNSYNNILLLLDKSLYKTKNLEILKNNLNIRIRTDICISQYYPIQIRIK